MPKMGLADADKRPFPGRVHGTVGRVHPVHVLRYPLRRARMLQFVFPGLTIAVRSAGRMVHLADNEGIVHVTGWVGIWFAALSAIYLAMGEVLNRRFRPHHSTDW
ncbi:hypothetical protein MJ588_04620 [Klebsiella pneumoniae]|nr:hypothetical protein MJ588_04620 [Klebsiella pneumoniae]